MIKSSISIFLIGCCMNSFCQSKKIQQKEEPTNLRLSYTGVFIYPGIKLGLELPVLAIEKNKVGRKEKHKTKKHFITSNLGFYHHKNFHTNTFLTVGYSYRKLDKNGFFKDLSTELGYSRTFLGGTTYNVDDNGSASIKKAAGYNHAISSLGIGMGYDFAKKKQKPISVFGKINLLLMLPYNNTRYVRPSLEVGINYRLEKLLTKNTKLIIKNS